MFSQKNGYLAIAARLGVGGQVLPRLEGEEGSEVDNCYAEVEAGATGTVVGHCSLTGK